MKIVKEQKHLAADAIKNIAIFASGSGTNAEKIIEHFIDHLSIKVALIVCNVSTAGVIQRAVKFKIPYLLINKKDFFSSDVYVDELKKTGINFIVLAGFFWKVPDNLIEAYKNKIINIHPALLPAFGGKGMYGMNVHKAVIDAKEKESGITIHYVDEHYDNGDIILQVRCPVFENDTPDSLASRIHELEHEHFAKVIERLVEEKL